MRQEEFRRLLEEHEQIVNEINKFETKISAKTTLATVATVASATSAVAASANQISKPTMATVEKNVSVLQSGKITNINE